jgi:3-polyprenyl-4-hydroxybenzoate decarboxylase
MPYEDMREYLSALEAAGQLKHVDVPLHCDREHSELQALMRHLHNIDGPALVLDNLQGYNTPNVPVVFNPYGTRERTAMSIELHDPLAAKQKHAGVLSDRGSWQKPRLVDRADAPCKDVVINKADVSLGEQIPHVWFGKEGPAYITGGIAITKDPETGERNVGWYRHTQLWHATHPTGGAYSEERQKNCLAVFSYWNPPMNHIGLHLFKAVQQNKPLEVAIAVCCEPAIHLASATGLPYGIDEYDFAGGLRGKPLDVVKCDTVDLEVPATSEWILEGVMLPREEEVIGWHSNPIGYYDKAQTFPVMQVNHITHRHNPLWHSTMEMVPPFDHNYIALLPVEGEVLSDLQHKIPEVKDVVVTPNMSYIVQLSVDGASKPHPEFGKYVLHAVWGAAGRWGRTAKLVVVVGPDVDPYDMDQIEWAIMSRVQPYSDTIINRSGQAFVLDPSAPKAPQGVPVQSEQMGIDATIKIPERFNDYPEVSNADPADVAAVAEKLKGVLG